MKTAARCFRLPAESRRGASDKGKVSLRVPGGGHGIPKSGYLRLSLTTAQGVWRACGSISLIWNIILKWARRRFTAKWKYTNHLQMVSPEYETISDETEDILTAGRIVPIYPLTKGMSQRYLRKVLKNCLGRHIEELPDLLPVYLRNKYRLSNIRRSIQTLHFPENFAQQEEAHRRVAFEEFFFFQISVILRRMSIVQKAGIAHHVDRALVEQFIHFIPFQYRQRSSG